MSLTVYYRRLLYRGFLLCALQLMILPLSCALAAEQQNGDAARTQPGAVFVCDSIDAGKPQGRAVVFAAAQGTLYCYSDFVRVAGQEPITHRWFFRDREVGQFRLIIQPPRWSSYSSLKIPADSTGPWRVEVLDQDGGLYGTARFSIVE